MTYNILLTLYCVLEIFVYMLLYNLLFGVKAHNNVRRIVLVFVGYGLLLFALLQSGLLSHLFGEITINNVALSLLMLTSELLIIPTFLLEERHLKWYLVFISPPIIMTALGSVYEGILALIQNKSLYELSHERTLIESICLDFLCLLTIGIPLLKDKLTLRSQENRIYNNEYLVYICIVSVVCSMFISGIESITSESSVSSWEYTLMEIAVYLLSVLYVIFIVQLARKAQLQINLVRNQASAEALLEAQEERILMIQDKDQEIRRFRHDYASHLRAITGMAKEGKTAEIISYIDALNSAFNNSQILMYTGITAVDAIIQDVATKMNDNAIKLEWTGSLGSVTSINLFDLSVIFMNLMQNAYEATLQNNNPDDKWIKVNVYNYSERIVVDIRNHFDGSISVSSTGNFQTTKPDINNHGFGLKNVKRVVEKYNGTININTNDNIFEVYICI